MSSENRARKLICLTGFMGSGKSTAAGLVARQLGWQHVDLDKRITDSAGFSIPEIFARLGEGEFRRMEFEQLRRVVGSSWKAASRALSRWAAEQFHSRKIWRFFVKTARR